MKHRDHGLSVAQTQEFDLVVIGGGIAGAGIAQDAASRGLSVIIIEKEDFASGTSSKTTKLIHGGLRYLEQMHFKLTRELCQERELLEQLAPHMVRDFNFVLPTGRRNWFFGLKARLGLTIYDIVSWSATHQRHEALSQDETLSVAPSLSNKMVSGGLRFHDAITDDSRLVVEVIKSACHLGATAVNYTEAKGFVIENGRLVGVNCRDRLNGTEFVIKGQSFVNATGVWVDQVFKMLDRNWGKHVAPSKGIHIIVPNSAFETSTALFLPTTDGRYVFVIPWQRALMIGTTDHPYHGELENPIPAGDEIDYLLSVVNEYTDSHKLSRKDITGSFAGLRPLVEDPLHDEDSSGASREHRIFDGPYGVIGLTGGKLTNYRLMAKQVVDKALLKLPEEEQDHIGKSRTQTIMLGGWLDKQDFLTASAAISARARKMKLEPAAIDHLVSSYGADAQRVLDYLEAEPQLSERICPDFPPLMADVKFCVEQEMAVSLEDMLFRRLRLGLVHQRQCMEAAPRVAKLMAQLLNWDTVRMDHELKAVDSLLDEHLKLVCVPA
ncbi:MAG: glycerol-3-phosphate dehydrogenase/oxidase [Candidatus Obscuribacterales bacterium]|nr:glycerol-3-phosphate dehydrogenase/oxidase [Candidatus Obscuribacterales bacterium]